MSHTITPEAEKQTERLALHVGLMVALLHKGAPITLVQIQCQHLIGMAREYMEVDSPGAHIQVDQLLPDDVAEALSAGPAVPDDLSSFDDSEEAP